VWSCSLSQWEVVGKAFGVVVTLSDFERISIFSGLCMYVFMGVAYVEIAHSIIAYLCVW
jgi:hypothetical protein